MNGRMPTSSPRDGLTRLRPRGSSDSARRYGCGPIDGELYGADVSATFLRRGEEAAMCEEAACANGKAFQKRNGGLEQDPAQVAQIYGRALKALVYDSVAAERIDDVSANETKRLHPRGLSELNPFLPGFHDRQRAVAAPSCNGRSLMKGE